VLTRLWHNGWLAAIVITLAGGALRMVDLGAVRLDPFYDAAVRSMGLSWHNFFFGAFEPGGSVSIDKPPVDLWLQVASVKTLGWGSTSLKLPEALAGTLSVPLLYAAVRRAFGVRAGLGAALAMAVMPIEVITARSDTMDAVMMALATLALLLLVRACETGGTSWLLGAAAALGLAFNVKLLESLVALPGLATIAWLGLAPRRRDRRARARRLARLGAAAAVYVAVALAWLTATLLYPAAHRPWAIGSTNGSAWNAAFVFNGADRLSGKAVEGSQPGFQPNHVYPQATESQRENIPITPPSATRLLARVGPLPGQRLGLMVLVALLLGAPAVLLSLRDPPAVSRAMGVGLLIWLGCGIFLYSSMARLHPRYTEGFTPAVAALIGIGAAWATGARGRARLATLIVGLTALVGYSVRLLYGTPAVWWVTLAAAAGAILAAALAQAPRWAESAARATRLRQAALLLTLVATLVIPLRASIEAIKLKASDAGNVGALRSDELLPLSAYLRAHQGGARYEVAADSPTKIASLVVRDVRPVIVLTSFNARPLTSVATLQRLIAAGEVRYAFLDSVCGPNTPRTDADCAPAALWVRAHGTDVSRTARMPRDGMLWLLPGAVA
jgi:4-amino-4-deoxy-L-arabinose transferase-like glycosyltransferase